MQLEKVLEMLRSVRYEAKRRVLAYANQSGNPKLIREVSLCLLTNEARPVAGLGEETYELLVIYEEMHQSAIRLAKLIK